MSEYMTTADAVVLTENDKAGEPGNRFPIALQVVRDGFATLNANPGDVGELIESGTDPGGLGYFLCPEATGQILMSLLPIPETEHGSRLAPEAKIYWMQVASHMGPNWIAELRRVAAFMDKVDQF